MVDGLAFSIAEMIIKSYNNMGYDLMIESRNVVSVIPDENSLNEAINKGISMAANSLNSTVEDVMTFSQDILQMLKNAFYAKSEEQNPVQENNLIHNIDDELENN